MEKNNNTTTVTINRIINAPVETVWKMWTDPESITKWWGPTDFTAPSAKVDLREGGSYLFCMRAPEYQGGQDSYTGGEYEEIVPMKKLVFTQRLTDADGKPVPKDKRPPNFPDEILTTILFKDVNGLTELKIDEEGLTLSQMSVYSYAGMHQSLDKMSVIIK